ncbi:MAG: hypothetical protein Q9198_008334 [Flavoplaca austrocitrina]
MPKITLRDLPQSQFHFLKPSHEDQFSQVVHDKTADGDVKQVSKQDTFTMALNEIATHRKRGFFWYFKSRDEWVKSPKEALCHGDNTVYPIQYIPHGRMPVYATSPETLVVFANSNEYYIGRSSKIEQLIGRWSQRRRPTEADLPLRLNTTPYIWTGATQGQAHALSHLAVSGIEQLYDRIVGACSPALEREHLISPLAIEDLRATFPRPLSSEMGIPLGVPLPVQRETREDPAATGAPATLPALPHDSSNPPNRRGTRRKKNLNGSDMEDIFQE